MDFSLDIDENIEWLMQTSAAVEQLAEKGLNIHEPEEERQRKQFLQVLQAAFKDEPFIKESTASGAIRGELDFQSLLRKLKAIGYFFAIRSSKSSQTIEKKIICKRPDFKPVNHPYIVNKTVRYYCTGRRKEHRKNHSDKERRSLCCKATMIVRHVSLFTKINIAPLQIQRTQMFRKLKKNLADGIAGGTEEIWVKIPLPCLHQHPLVDGSTLDCEVKASMHKLISEQTLTTKQVQRKLRDIVKEEFSRQIVQPSFENKTFFPSEKIIYNHLRHEEGLAKKKRRRALDMEKLRLGTLTRLATVQTAVEKCSNEIVLKSATALLRKLELLFPLSSAEQ